MARVSELVVLYNSVCPVCREGICWAEKRTKNGREGVRYVDVSASPAAYEDRGVTLDDVRLKLHAITPDGAVLKGWPAVSALWRRTPGYGWLAKLGDAPGLNALFRALYHGVAHGLWRINRLAGRW
jgi:predicted DCC family thiol-disulfide oxidoreductase YuxK